MKVLSLAVLVVLQAGSAQLPRHRMEGTTFKPERHAATADTVRDLKVPVGFEVQVFAENLGNPRMIAVAADGAVYGTRPEQNDVIRLRDADGNGRADGTPVTVARDLERVHGIAIHDGRIFLATVQDIYSGQLNPGGAAIELKKIAERLPDGGQHPNRTLGVGPDGMLYVSVGSSCNACDETNPEHATILQMKLDGQDRQVFARGLRNTIGFDWHPETGELWGMDHGSDWRGDERPREELNRIVKDAHYGWPFCLESKQPDTLLAQEPRKISKEAFCEASLPPVLMYEAHSAPIQMAFHPGNNLPPDSRGDAFVAMHGSWNRAMPTGYKVVRIRFGQGKPAVFEDFVTGFLSENSNAFSGRPAGLAVGADGAILFSDDINGRIYRVAFSAGAAGSKR
jgi:glucose/arabinose dehydrogenase